MDLRSAGFFNAFRRANGGYILTRAPNEITVGQVVNVLEDMAPVECVKDARVCGRMETCSANEVWRHLNNAIQETLGCITLEDMLVFGRRKNEKTKIRSNKMSLEQLKPETLALHAGQQADPRSMRRCYAPPCSYSFSHALRLKR